MAAAHDLVVRPVTCDAPDFARLVAAFETELEARYPGIGDEAGPLAPALLVAVVAYRDGEPVGCGALRELEPGIGEVKRMFVLPQSRGLGAARRILAALEEHGRGLGYRAVRLGSGVRQPEALALYESSGYHRIPLFGEYEGAALCVCYEKALA